MLLDMIGAITIFVNVENVSKKTYQKKQFVRVFPEMSSIYSYMAMIVKKKYDQWISLGFVVGTICYLIRAAHVKKKDAVL